MGETKPVILVVDDADDSRTLLEVMLSDLYKVYGVNSGQACLDRLANMQPNLILLDIHMPGMNGFDVCKRLKANSSDAKIPLIFVSGTESIEERLRAYDEGADDYLPKPFTEADLIAKVDGALAHQRELQELSERSAQAMSTAMEAMTATGELGTLMGFVRTSMAINDFTEISREISRTLEQFGLVGCVLLYKAVGHLLTGCDEKSMEGKVLLTVGNDKPLLEFGKRVVLVRDNIRILIQNMPVDQEARYGRLKDNLNVLCDCANARIGSLRLLHNMQIHRDKLLEQIIHKSEVQLDSVRQKLDHHAEESQRIMRQMVSELDERLLFLGLEEDQEKSLRKLADDTHENIESLSTINKEIYSSVDDVMQGLYQLVQNE